MSNELKFGDLHVNNEGDGLYRVKIGNTEVLLSLASVGVLSSNRVYVKAGQEFTIRCEVNTDYPKEPVNICEYQNKPEDHGPKISYAELRLKFEYLVRHPMIMTKSPLGDDYRYFIQQVWDNKRSDSLRGSAYISDVKKAVDFMVSSKILSRNVMAFFSNVVVGLTADNFVDYYNFGKGSWLRLKLDEYYRKSKAHYDFRLLHEMSSKLERMLDCKSGYISRADVMMLLDITDNKMIDYVKGFFNWLYMTDELGNDKLKF